MGFFKKKNDYQEFSDKYFLLSDNLKDFKSSLVNLKNHAYNIKKEDKYLKLLDQEQRDEYDAQIHEINLLLEKKTYILLSEGSPKKQLEDLEKSYLIGEKRNGEYYSIRPSTPSDYRVFKLDPKLSKKGKIKTIKVDYVDADVMKILEGAYILCDWVAIRENKEYYYLDIKGIPEIKTKVKELKALEMLLEDNNLISEVIEILDEKLNYLEIASENILNIKSRLEDELDELDEINNIMYDFAKEII